MKVLIFPESEQPLFLQALQILRNTYKDVVGFCGKLKISSMQRYTILLRYPALAHVPLCDENTKKSDLSLISREFTRMLDFAKSARNPLDIDNLREQILSAYGAYNIYSEET